MSVNTKNDATIELSDCNLTYNLSLSVTDKTDFPSKGSVLVVWIGRHLTDINQSVDFLRFVQDDCVDYYIMSVLQNVCWNP